MKKKKTQKTIPDKNYSNDMEEKLLIKKLKGGKNIQWVLFLILHNIIYYYLLTAILFAKPIRISNTSAN